MADDESAEAGTSGIGSGSTDQGSSSATTDPFSGLETGTREWIGTKGYKSVADVAKAAQNAESLIGRSVQIPGDDAKNDDWAKVYQRLGRPNSPDEYEFTRPEEMTEEQFAEAKKGIAQWAYDSGLTKRQAAEFAGKQLSNVVETMKANQTAQHERAVAETKKVEAIYGGPFGSPAYVAEQQLVERALSQFDPDGAFRAFAKTAGYITPEGQILDAGLVRFVHNIAKQNFREPRTSHGDPATSADNPFKEGPDTNMTQQGIYINKFGREKAELLIRQAGHDPKKWWPDPIAA